MSQGHANTLVAYTCDGQMSMGRANTLVAYTCGGQMSKRRACTLVAYTCGGQMSEGQPHLLLRGPAEPPLEAFGPLLVPLVGSNSPENGPNAHFLTFRA